MINGLTAADVVAAQQRYRDANPAIPNRIPMQQVADYLAAAEQINRQTALKETLSVSLKNVILTAGTRVETYNRHLSATPYELGARLNRQYAYDTQKVVNALAASGKTLVVDGRHISVLDHAAPKIINSDALRAADKASLLRREDFLVIGQPTSLNLAQVERRLNIGAHESRWSERAAGAVDIKTVHDVPRHAAQYLAANDALKNLESAQEARAAAIKDYLTAFGVFDEATNRLYSPDRSFSQSFYIRDVVDTERVKSWINQQVADLAVGRTKIPASDPMRTSLEADIDARISVLSCIVERKPASKALSDVFTTASDLDALLMAEDKRPYVLSVKRMKDTAPKAKAA